MGNKLTILIGPPGSGKSTHAAAMESQGYLRISQDDMGKEHLDIFHSHVTTGRDIVTDRMNFDKKQRDRYRLEAIKNGYTVNFVEFCVPRQVCYDRCMDRVGHPTITESKHANSALNTFFSRYEEVTEEEGEVLRIYYNAPEKSTAIMVDLDNTLCDTTHRNHFVQNKNWKDFFKHCDKDALYPEIKRMIDLEFSNGTSVVLCSGRPEDVCREKTEKWLIQNEIHYTTLKMRPAGNYKSDDITKAMLYRYEIKPYYDTIYVLDDRDQVVQKWREMGLNCWQVRPGDF